MMQKLCLFLILGVLSSDVLSMNFRVKRRIADIEDEDTRSREHEEVTTPYPEREYMSNLGHKVIPIPTRTPSEKQMYNLGELTSPRYPTVEPMHPNHPEYTNSPAHNGMQTMTYKQCMEQCPISAEQNCGTDNITYENLGRLLCAQSCGLNIKKVPRMRCPTPTTPVGRT